MQQIPSFKQIAQFSANTRDYDNVRCAFCGCVLDDVIEKDKLAKYGFCPKCGAVLLWTWEV